MGRHNPGPGLVTGRLKFVVKVEDVILTSLETEELTLSGPSQRIRVMFPPMSGPFQPDLLDVDISFKGKSFTGDLGKQVLQIPFATKVTYLALVGESRVLKKNDPQRKQVLQYLAFENLYVDPMEMKKDDENLGPAKTVFSSVEPADLPAEALSYCCYDLVVLLDDEFHNLKKPQLDALLAWVKAGGSLYLEPHGVLEKYHTEFLTNLTADDPHDLVLHLDPTGRLPLDTVPAGKAAVTLKCGLGDVVLRTADSSQPFEPSLNELREIISPIWKRRLNPVETQSVGANPFGAPGQWIPGGAAVIPPREINGPFRLSMAPFNRFQLSSTELLDRLMPEDVQMVPLMLLAFILFSFVCLIGPGEYFFLGWLRQRKMTWITFPLATIGVTLLTVWISNRYLNTAETRRAIVVRDLDRKGETVRTNRFELLFLSSAHQMTTEVEKSVFTSLNTGSVQNSFTVMLAPGPGFAANGRNFNAQQINVVNVNGQQVLVAGSLRNPGDGSTRPATTAFQGRIPTLFEANQDLPKWTPHFNRLFSIPGSATSPEIDWSEFELIQVELNNVNQHQLPQRLLENVRKQFGPQAMLACFTAAQEGWAYDQGASWRSSRNTGIPGQTNNGIFVQQNFNVVLSAGMTSPFDGTSQQRALGQADLFRWLYNASVAETTVGTFALTKQTVPKGGANCEDLLLLDTSDPNSWLLCVVVPGKK